ncbi:HTH-type transcriptional regulator CynR [Variovorax boronicumulans]|uniref:LysR family transcriptional regulator n=1 Tax=Variovorax boronicumulans TaxID=436515 RepID=UPI000BB39B7C|nr:LysR family transcriptional regulator [Variovorax boronicumulans]PBI85830.1 HTH-type transcriptional regulator CynR [Variovorax boronicumulans]
MNLTTRQMRAFLQVARIGNFTRAAEQAHITQAGLSILIREMEKQLGCRLFDRTTRMVSLTPAGRRLLPVVERLVTDLDDVAAELGAEGDAARQTLRIAATPLVSSHLLPWVFASFRAAHPQVALRLFDADLGLGFFFKAAAGLDRTPVGRFELMRVTQATADGEPVGTAPWSALRGATLIGLPPGNPIQKVIERQLGEIGLADAQRPAFNFFGTLISMVEAGFGTAVMPTFALAACRRHRVKTDVLLKPRVGMDFFRLTKRGTQETEAMRAFSETLAKALPALSR